MYELITPVCFRSVLKFLAKIMTGAGIVLMVPLLVALIFNEYRVAAIYGVTVAGIIAAGIIIDRTLPDCELQKKEALFIAALFFPFFALLSTLPIAEVAGMPLFDAFFEAVSGVTTTGLTVSASSDPLFLFTRSWLQWIGGIGILVMAVLIFASPGTSALRLYTVNVGEVRIRPTVFSTAVFILKIYGFLTIISFILFFTGGMPFFDAICHTLSSVSTGGFSTSSQSLSGFTGAALPLLVTICCIMGAVNFSSYSGKKGILSVFWDVQFRYLLITGLVGSVLLYITMAGGGSSSEIISDSAFQAFSALTTSGFSTMDIGGIPEESKAVLTALMWIGGSLGSTAGGIKIIRLIILLKIVHIVFMRFFLPEEALTPLKIDGEVAGLNIVLNTVALIFLYSVILIISAFIFMLFGYSLSNSLFEVSSALGTVGLSCGITDAALPVVLKAVLIIDMVLGRIEIMPLFILLYPGAWIGRRKK